MRIGCGALLGLAALFVSGLGLWMYFYVPKRVPPNLPPFTGRGLFVMVGDGEDPGPPYYRLLSTPGLECRVLHGLSAVDWYISVGGEGLLCKQAPEALDLVSLEQGTRRVVRVPGLVPGGIVGVEFVGGYLIIMQKARWFIRKDGRSWSIPNPVAAHTDDAKPGGQSVVSIDKTHVVYVYGGGDGLGAYVIDLRDGACRPLPDIRRKLTPWSWCVDHAMSRVYVLSCGHDNWDMLESFKWDGKGLAVQSAARLPLDKAIGRYDEPVALTGTGLVGLQTYYGSQYRGFPSEAFGPFVVVSTDTGKMEQALPEANEGSSWALLSVEDWIPRSGPAPPTGWRSLLGLPE